ncbi:MAG TPA: CoA pyrophosphatase [Pseudobdellovibrionaceae bacterium]|jgi:8-oxo-dGTP pyrophosphatase MutT (NUDIX family)
MSKSKSELEEILSQGPHTDLSKTFSKASGVALLLCNTGANTEIDPLSRLELLFIKRATNPKDHWSGHIAFPGGKQDEGDPSLLAACLREVQEEVGLHLSEDSLIGFLDDLQARKHGNLLEFYIRPFVFSLKEKPFVKAVADEVEKTLWVPLNYLTDTKNHITYTLTRDQIKLELPGIQLPDGEVLWGLTYTMVQNLLRNLQA